MIEWLFLILIWTYIGHYYLFDLLARNKKLFYNKRERSKIKFSIIIPVNKKSEILKDKIKNTLQVSYPKKLVEIIVVDNHSGDNSDIKNIFPMIKYIKRAKKGLNSGLNQALSIANGGIIIKTDHDTFVSKDALKIFEQILKSNPDIGAIAATEKVSGNELMKSYRDFLNKIHINESLVHSTWISGSFYAFRKNVIESFPETRLVPDDGYISLQCVNKSLRAVSTDLVKVKEIVSKKNTQNFFKFRRYVSQGIYTYFSNLPIIFKNKFFFLVSLRNLFHFIVTPLIIYYFLFFHPNLFLILVLFGFFISLFSTKIRNLAILFLIFLIIWPIAVLFAIFKIEKW